MDHDGQMTSIVDLWPLAGLVVRSPRLVLRWPKDDDLVALAELAAAGAHDPDEMPFLTPWTRGSPGEVSQRALQYHWQRRADWTLENWSWNPVVVVDGQIVGSQACGATDFGVRRTVATGSWLGRAYQGQGIGTEMRRAVLHFAFAGLGAWRAETGAFEDNQASLNVTKRLGYQANGDAIHEVEGRRRRELRFVIDAATWAANRGDEDPAIEIDGLEPCRAFFGATPQS